MLNNRTAGSCIGTALFFFAVLVNQERAMFAQATVTPAPGSHVTAAPTSAAPAMAPGAAQPSGSEVKSGTTASTDGPATITTSPTPGATVTTTTAPGASTTTAQQPPNGVEIEIGVVSRVNGAISSYQVSNGALSLSTLGRATPQLLTGLGFSCDTSTTTTTSSNNTGATVTSTSRNADHNAFCNNPFAKHLGAYASAQIGTGTGQTISGYSFGLTYAVNRYLRVLAGFSLTPSNEVSPGFANAAAQYVSKNPTLFPGVNPTNLSSNNYGAFDGLQITTTAPAAGAPPTTAIYYAGSPTETRYRGGFIIGIALPINIYNLLGGSSKSQ